MSLPGPTARYIASISITPTGPGARRVRVTASHGTAGQAVRWLRRHLTAALQETSSGARSRSNPWLADPEAYQEAVFALAGGRVATATWIDGRQVIALAAVRLTARRHRPSPRTVPRQHADPADSVHRGPLPSPP